MGVRITDNRTFALYDSVSGFAFGPTFDTEDEARGFVDFVTNRYGKDARTLTDKELEEAWAAFDTYNPVNNPS